MPSRNRRDGSEQNAVIASEAKQSRATGTDWIASSQVLLAMTRSGLSPACEPHQPRVARQRRLGGGRRKRQKEQEARQRRAQTNPPRPQPGPRFLAKEAV